MRTSLSADSTRDLISALQQHNSNFAEAYPGESGRRQPVHTVYGGAHLFSSDSAQRLGALARRSLDQFAPDFLMFAKTIGLPEANKLPESLEREEELVALLETDSDRMRRQDRPAWLAHTIYKRVTEKLKREPVEDFRIDFEDGYGNRSDAEEDGHSTSAAAEVAGGMKAETLPPFIGIRIKPAERCRIISLSHCRKLQYRNKLQPWPNSAGCWKKTWAFRQAH